MSRKQESATQDFEKSFEQLQKTVRRLESGELSLEDSLKEFEMGVKLTRECQDYLKKAEKRIQILTGQTPEGEAVLEPFSKESV